MSKSNRYEKYYRARGQYEFREYNYKCNCHDCRKRRKHGQYK